MITYRKKHLCMSLNPSSVKLKTDVDAFPLPQPQHPYFSMDSFKVLLLSAIFLHSREVALVIYHKLTYISQISRDQALFISESQTLCSTHFRSTSHSTFYLLHTEQ